MLWILCLVMDVNFFLKLYFPFDLQACDRLLGMRVELKMRTRKSESILNRVHVAMPAPRDNKVRKPFIPSESLGRTLPSYIYSDSQFNASKRADGVTHQPIKIRSA